VSRVSCLGSLGFVAILSDARREECRSPSDVGHREEKSGIVSQWAHVRWRTQLDYTSGKSQDRCTTTVFNVGDCRHAQISDSKEQRRLNPRNCTTTISEAIKGDAVRSLGF
jgi:hypothetical protein